MFFLKTRGSKYTEEDAHPAQLLLLAVNKKKLNKKFKKKHDFTQITCDAIKQIESEVG